MLLGHAAAVTLMRTNVNSDTAWGSSEAGSPDGTYYAVEPGNGPSCLQGPKNQLEQVTIPNFIGDGWHRWKTAHVKNGTCAAAGYAFEPFYNVWGATEFFKDRVGLLAHFLTEVRNHPDRIGNMGTAIIMQLKLLPEMTTLLRACS